MRSLVAPQGESAALESDPSWMTSLEDFAAQTSDNHLLLLLNGSSPGNNIQGDPHEYQEGLDEAITARYLFTGLNSVLRFQGQYPLG